MPADPRNIKGRGATANPANPFEALHLEDDPEWHYRPPSPDEVERAVKELSTQCATLSSVR